MKITVRQLEATALDVELADLMTLQEVRLSASGLTFEALPGGQLAVAQADATIVVTEAMVNRLLARYPPEGGRDIEIATLAGRVRISGKWRVNGLPVPFDLTGAPEIEGGARLRINVQQVRALGALVLPGFVVQGIGNKLNDAFARAFDVTRLALPVRLTKVKVEPGRILLSGTAAVEVRPCEPAGEVEMVEGGRG
jgi:hypothetical protein